MKVKPNNYIAIEFPSRSVNEEITEIREECNR